MLKIFKSCWAEAGKKDIASASSNSRKPLLQAALRQVCGLMLPDEDEQQPGSILFLRFTFAVQIRFTTIKPADDASAGLMFVFLFLTRLKAGIPQAFRFVLSCDAAFTDTRLYSK
ncbi:MAG: hypothetical protein ACOYJC_10215 [Christensenellales bacterium]|jgi:hypothetical protein